MLDELEAGQKSSRRALVRAASHTASKLRTNPLVGELASHVLTVLANSAEAGMLRDPGAFARETGVAFGFCL